MERAGCQKRVLAKKKEEKMGKEREEEEG